MLICLHAKFLLLSRSGLCIFLSTMLTYIFQESLFPKLFVKFSGSGLTAHLVDVGYCGKVGGGVCCR